MNAVELFTPFFSEGIANHILQKHKLGTPLTIFEVAKGSVTNMKAILSYYKSKFPNVYKTLRYYFLTDEWSFPFLSIYSVYFKPLSIPDEFADKVQLYSIVLAQPFLSLSSRTKSIAPSSAIPRFSSSTTCWVHFPTTKSAFTTAAKAIRSTNTSSVSSFPAEKHSRSSFCRFRIGFVSSPVSDPLIRQYVEFLLASEYSMITLAEHQNATIDAYNRNSALGNNRASRFKKFIPSEAFIPTVFLDLLNRVTRLTTDLHIVGYGRNARFLLFRRLRLSSTLCRGRSELADQLCEWPDRVQLWWKRTVHRPSIVSGGKVYLRYLLPHRF